MADTTVAVDRLEALQVGLKFAAQVTLDDDFLGGDGRDDRTDLLGAEFLGPGVGVDIGLFEDALGGLGSDSVDVTKGGLDALVTGNFYAEKSWHGRVVLGMERGLEKGSALTLFMAGVLADDTHHVIAADDLAGFAKTFNGSSDFHAKSDL